MQEIYEIEKTELRRKIFELVIPKMIWEKPLTDYERQLRKEWISRTNLNIDVLKFYTNKKVLFEIVKHLGTKELIFDKSIRWLYASKIDSLIFCMQFYSVFEKLKTFYCGLADFHRRERPPFDPKEKKEWQKNEWTSAENPEFMKQVKSYDLAFDFDGDTVEESYKDAKKLFNHLKKYNIKFAVWFSGKRGFHFLIPSSEFEGLIKPYSVDNAVEFCKAIAYDLADKLKFKSFDDTIYTMTRFIKCPFTLDQRNNKVIFPLNDEEFNMFLKNESLYTSMEYTLKQSNLGYIGAYRDRKSNPEGFIQLVNDL